jgi:peroxiredoxin
VQLVELQEAWRTIQENGVAVFAISYDSVSALAAFPEKHGITYPLLSDEGSQIIRQLGLLNEEHLIAQHAFYGIQTRDEQRGVAYPGTFELDAHGIISHKYFEQSYRVRPTARIFEEYALGSAAAAPPHVEAQQASSAGIEVRVWADAPTYRPYQQLRLHVEVSLPPEMHVFAAPVPDGFTPLSPHVEPLDGLDVGLPSLPTPQPLSFAGLEEKFFAYEGTLQAVLPLRFTKNLGATVVRLHVEYQACTSTVCFPPHALRVDIHLNGVDLIRD